jgi:hypothetical protein
MRRAIDTDIIYRHHRRVRGRGVGISREVSVHCEIHDDEKRMIEHPIAGNVTRVLDGEIDVAGVVPTKLRLIRDQMIP